MSASLEFCAFRKTNPQHTHPARQFVPQALRTLGNVMKDNSENRNAFIAKVVDSEDGGQKQPVLPQPPV